MIAIPHADPLMSTLASPSVKAATFWMPEQASTTAHDVDFMFYFIYWVSLFFFVAIVGITGYFVVKYRQTDAAHASNADGPTHNMPLEIFWSVIPLGLVIIMFYLGMKSYLDLRVAPAETYDVYVTGYKWAWQFDHSCATEAGQLHVPEDQPVKFIMTSTDVLHSMFIPAFRVKQDVVPGRYSTLWFEAKEDGDYRIFCTEYCGTQHSQMLANLTVVPQEDWDAELEQLCNWIDDYPEEDLYKAGPRLYARCSSCHSLDGAPGTGPSFLETHQLWKDGQPRVMSDGSEVMITEDYIMNSILVPQQNIVQNYSGAMPSFQGQLKPRELRALVEFIRNLDKFDRDGNLIEE